MPTPSGRRSSTLAAGTASVVLAVLAAGCGGSSNARVASISDTSTSASAGTKSWPAVYHCYAAHGFPKFRLVGSPSVPSAPPISGWWRMPNGNYGFTPALVKTINTPKFQTAQKVCDAFIPDKPLTPAQIAARVAQARKVAKCMQSHGMPNLPDPESDGLIHLESAGEDNTPKFLRAQSACQSLMTHGIPFLVPTG